ncbi:MAG: hypothetical protein IJQ23_03595 [Clostridia bacterium]|nr:hypothetical protein [Clostridia bacterium]
MAEWKDPKSDYVAGDQVTPEIFNTLAENEKFLKENTPMYIRPLATSTDTMIAGIVFVEV